MFLHFPYTESNSKQKIVVAVQQRTRVHRVCELWLLTAAMATVVPPAGGQIHIRINIGVEARWSNIEGRRVGRVGRVGTTIGGLLEEGLY